MEFVLFGDLSHSKQLYDLFQLEKHCVFNRYRANEKFQSDFEVINLYIRDVE